VSDSDTGVVVSLKVLDPDGRLEKRTRPDRFMSTRPSLDDERTIRLRLRDPLHGPLSFITKTLGIITISL